MLVKDCRKCKYFSIPPELKDIYALMHENEKVNMFEICKHKMNNSDWNEIYCFTSSQELDLKEASKAYQRWLSGSK